MEYAYTSYGEIPKNIEEYIIDVALVDSLDELSIEDINAFLNETVLYYEKNGLFLEDFLE